MIRTRLFMGFAALVITFGILSAFIGVRLIQNSVITEAQTRVRSDLNSAWSVANAELRNIETILRLAAGKQLIIEACSTAKWPDQEVQNRLELIRMNLGLDFLTIISPDGQVVVRAAPPYRTGDFRLSNATILKALKGEIAVGMALMSNKELELEHEGLSEKAYLILEDTPHARPDTRKVETRGMVKIGAVPIEKGNQLLGVIYGGILLNKNHNYVDYIANSLFKGEVHGEAPTGTFTIFLHDSRIATTVRLPNGNRALGTRVSKEVAERVLDNGKRWEGRAFVVNDWYLTAYDPIWDGEGKVVGMLYVGILEQPFKDLIKDIIVKYILLSVFGLTVALILAFFLAGTLSRPLHRLAKAAQKMLLGEPPKPVPLEHTSRETKALIQAFNKMTETITERETKLKETNEKLEEANTSLISLNRNYMETVGFISHELKSPLSTIMNYIYLIHEHKLGPLTEKQEKAVKNVDNNVRLIVEMVRHYLNLSRIENGELQPITSRVELVEEVLKPLLDSFEAALEECHMTVTMTIDPQVMLQSDLNMTRELFENLISNAIKYGRQGGLIKLSSQENADFIRFSVFNEGEGIAPDKINTLFQKFSRLEEDKTTRTQKGTGLGLFITKHIITAHGGEIEVQNKPGEGVEFLFTLPRWREEKTTDVNAN